MLVKVGAGFVRGEALIDEDRSHERSRVLLERCQDALECLLLRCI